MEIRQQSWVWQKARIRRPCACYCFPGLSENFNIEVSETYICGHLCVTSLLSCICSPKILSIVFRCGYLLLNVTFSFLSARCIGWPGFALINLYCRCVIDVMLLSYECFTRFNRTRITVCSASFHPLLPEFDIPSCGRLPSIGVWSIKVYTSPNLHGLSCRPRFECGMTFPTLCLTLERWMGSRVQSTVGWFPELCFLQFSVAQLHVGLRKQFI